MIPILFEKSQDVGVSTSGYLAAIITAGIRVLGGVIGIFLIRTMPRVRLAMLSLTLLSVSMMVLGTVYYLKQFYDKNAEAFCTFYYIHFFYNLQQRMGKKWVKNVYMINKIINLYDKYKFQAPLTF